MTVFTELSNKWDRPYPFKFFKGCLPQILLGSFFNTLSQIQSFLNANYVTEYLSSSLETVSKEANEFKENMKQDPCYQHLSDKEKQVF